MNYKQFIISRVKAKSALHSKAFTLIETLVAISILMISIAGPMSFASQGLQASIYARDQITAFYLAQDAIEEVRNIRDTNAIKIQDDPSIDWLDNIRSCIGFSCTVDSTAYDNQALQKCSGTCASLKQQIGGVSPGYFYGYTSGADWVDSRFTRVIDITQINTDEIALSVKISWRSGAILKSFNARENMYNIYGGL